MMREDFGTILKTGVGLILLIVLLALVAQVLGLINLSAQVAIDEFGPQAALKKYEWFIDQQNYIEKADKDIALFEQRRADVDIQFTKTYGADRSKWLPSTQVLYNQAAGTARDDLVAVVSNRNNLVREYNAQSLKFNWTPFQTRADLPPRSIFEYVVK